MEVIHTAYSCTCFTLVKDGWEVHKTHFEDHVFFVDHSECSMSTWDCVYLLHYSDTQSTQWEDPRTTFLPLPSYKQVISSGKFSLCLGAHAPKTYGSHSLISRPHLLCKFWIWEWVWCHTSIFLGLKQYRCTETEGLNLIGHCLIILTHCDS